MSANMISNLYLSLVPLDMDGFRHASSLINGCVMRLVKLVELIVTVPLVIGVVFLVICVLRGILGLFADFMRMLRK